MGKVNTRFSFFEAENKPFRRRLPRSVEQIMTDLAQSVQLEVEIHLEDASCLFTPCGLRSHDRMRSDHREQAFITKS